MLNVGSRPRDDVMTDQAGYVAGQVDDWELVNREAHHRMKNTLMLLAASVRRDFRREKISGLSAAVSRFERRIVAFGQLYHLLSSSLSAKPCRRQFWSLPPFVVRQPSRTANCLRRKVIASA